MGLYTSSKVDLYRFGMSQPPWLLALANRYVRLEGAWNCRGLGREITNKEELQKLKSCGWLDKVTKDLGVTQDPYTIGFRRPFIAMCSARAKLMHFNGPMKPWSAAEELLPHERGPGATIKKPVGPKKPSLCAVPPGTFPAGALWAKGVGFVNC